ncbi:MAG TPA: hypothetical protein VF553_14675 [Pyrinomonadaceae bacterium]|jgi:hypothetical protein
MVINSGTLMSAALFKSFFLGGFECSTHRTREGRRLDMLASTEHDKYAAADYARLREIGILTARDGIRWHLIEPTPYRYDFSSVLPMVRAARDAKMQVIWDVCHYGWPDDLDVFSPAFIKRYSRLIREFSHILKNETDGVQFICPVNEISFLSWASAEVGYIFPYAESRGNELKAQLVRAVIEGIEAVWDVLPQTRIIHADPLINIIAEPTQPEKAGAAEAYRLSQFAAWDMICGKYLPALGGDEKYLDVIGVNFYPHNQWMFGSLPYNPSFAVDRSHPLYKPFRRMLCEVYERYKRPLLVAETGAENELRPGWLRYVCDEVRAAMEAAVPVAAICLYPIINHPGWDDNRHCHNGLWEYPTATGEREIYQPLADELRAQMSIFEADD